MNKYETIRAICENNSRISSKVIDDFLIHFAASRNHLEQKMDKKFAIYRHVTRTFQKEWVNYMKSQYLAHQIFRENGLIEKLLDHPALNRLTTEEMSFLQKQAEIPWRFSFSMVIEEPYKDFYIMEDLFSSEQFTLFSPGITNLLNEYPVMLWLNLIGNNGECWQSFGPITGFKSFDLDDIYFFATELNPNIEDKRDLLEDLENNPVPYMMMFSGANYPMTFHQKDQFVQELAEYDLETINTKKLKQSFTSEYTNEVYRFTLNGWGGPPHFATAYYDENEKIIVLHAMTHRGFQALITDLNAYGYNFEKEPFISVHPSMLTTAKNILRKEISLNEYEDMFKTESSEEDQDLVDHLNTFMAMILPDINAGRKPDIESLAKKAGVDIETAHDIVQNLINKLDKPGK